MKWIKTAKTNVSANRYGSHPSLDHNGRQPGASRSFHQFRRRLLRARPDNHFEQQSRFPGHCAVRPMPADLIEVALLRIWMPGSCEAVEFIQFDVLSRNACDDFPVGGF